MSKVSDYVDNLLSRLRDGEVASLARAISLVDSHADVGNALHHAVRPFTGQAEVIGITGPPGAGKSTLINALITELRGQDKRVAVVAVDPSSPISGGSVLGDRTRMGEHTDDPDVFIRSLSARGHLGGLSASVLRVVDLIDAAGWDVVILETVGAGQSETEVAEVADINVVINAPGLGDDVQAIKAGILEIADVLVVNKADSPLAQRTERQLKAMLQLRREESQQVPVVSTIATAGSGIEELVSAIRSQSQSKFNASKSERLLDRTRRLLAQQAAEQLKCWLQGDTSPESASIITAVIEGNCDNEQAITDLIRIRYGAIL
jgi:LAO/AO transport system kinase